jgi:pyruvate dehydrogenase E2 component (dihydrolipoamide acetyltransferase)
MFEFKLPDLGEGIHEGELIQWHVKVGDNIHEDDPLCDMETDKAAVTIPSPVTGVIAELNAKPGDTVQVGHVLVRIEDGSNSSVEPQVSERSVDTQVPEKKEAPVIAAPATRRKAREMGIDIGSVTGTGPGGRITPEDLDLFETGMMAEAPDHDRETGLQPPMTLDAIVSPVSGDGAGVPGKSSIPFLEVPLQPVAEHGPVERIPFRSLRKKTAIKTASASILIPHVAHMDDIDVTGIEAERREYNARYGEKGKLTLLGFVIKAVVSALKDWPMFNASVDLASNEIVHKLYYHVGFAADTPRGLMVPVIHDTDRKSLAGIGRRIRDLAHKARDGEITIEELSRGTFTITNVGAIGGTHVFPIINTPESAILGLGRVEKKPVVRDGEIVIRDMLPVTLCFDHRVADGAQAAAFVSTLRKLLEDPMAFLAET